MVSHIHIIFNPKQYVQANLEICHTYVNMTFVMSKRESK